MLDVVIIGPRKHLNSGRLLLISLRTFSNSLVIGISYISLMFLFKKNVLINNKIKRKAATHTIFFGPSYYFKKKRLPMKDRLSSKDRKSKTNRYFLQNKLPKKDNRSKNILNFN